MKISTKEVDAFLSQLMLNIAIKEWLESIGVRALVTGDKHEFVVSVKDLFSIKSYHIPDVVGIRDSSVVVVETETKLNQIYEAIVKCLIWKTMATWVYLALPTKTCRNLPVLKKYGIGLLSVSEQEVKEIIELPKERDESLPIFELHPWNPQREQELFRQIERHLK